MIANSKRAFSFLSALAIASFLFFIASAHADDQEKKQNKKTPAGISAMKAGKDADGAVRPPTRAEENKLNAEIKKTLTKYPKHTPKQKADGTVSLVIAPHRITATVAHIGPDGKLHLNCSDDAGHTNIQPVTTQELSEE